MTPDMLRGAYDFLRVTPPFNRWNLPPGEEVEFHVIKSKALMGDHTAGETHQIRISSGCHGHTVTVLITMAHEMVHMCCAMLGERSAHGRKFQQLARQVCQHHGFDPKAF